MKPIEFEDLESDKQIEYRKKAEAELSSELAALEGEGILQNVENSKPADDLPEDLKEAHAGMKQRRIDLGVKYNFAGSIEKIEQLVKLKRKNLDAPLTVKIKGVEVFLSVGPMLLLLNSAADEVNLKLDELIEQELK